MPLEGLAAEQLREVGSVLAKAGPALDDNSDEELRSYDLTITIANTLDALGQNDLSIKRQVAAALVNKAITLSILNRSKRRRPATKWCYGLAMP